MGFWSRSGKHRKKSKPTQERRGLKPLVETLERRDLLTGTWAPLVNQIPDPNGAQMALVLSNGTIMVLGGSDNTSNLWYALKPDTSGSYVNGTWSSLAPMNTSRLFFNSNVLPDGRVFVVGGEYSTPYSFTNSAEIYDPVKLTWKQVASVPSPATQVGSNPPPTARSQFGDDPTAVLPNGNILAGYFNDSRTFIYNPTTNSWSTNNTTATRKLRGDASDEESWIKLPDGSILSYDIFASIGSGVSSAERYIPSQNKWVDAGTITDGSGQPVLLTAIDTGFEIGPGILLPDGRVWQTGSTGNTAFYNPSTNKWALGPSLPNGLVATDNPAALLPNGNVLIAVSPFASDSQGNFAYPNPTSVLEFDPIANTYTDVTPSGFSLDQENAFATTMLVLPTGQVMMMNDTKQIEVYTPDGSPQASWAPTIQSIQGSGSTFTLTGTQLNGVSEGAVYGDDWGMSSNYPLVRLTNAATGKVSYARTSNWSSTGVQTGSTPVTTNFTLPGGFTPGTYLLSVVANGIASTPQLVVFGSNNGDTISITSGSVTFNGASSAYTPSAIMGIDVFAGDGSNTIKTLSTPAGLDVNLHGGAGTDSFTFGASGQVNGIAGAVSVDGGAGTNSATIDDSADATGRTITISGTQIGAASGDNLFTAGGSVALANIANVVLKGGTGGNQFNVLATNSGESLGIFSGTGANSIFVGSNGVGGGSLQNILGPVTITGQAAATALTIDASGSTTGNTLTLDGSSVSSSANNLFGAGGSLAYSGLAALTVNDGSGGNQIEVHKTAASTITTINTGSGDDNVTIANPGNGTGDVNGILSSLFINGQGGGNALLIEDRNDAAAKTFTITSSQIGAAVGDNLFGAGGSLGYTGINALTLNGSSGGNTIFVQSTSGGALHLLSGAGSDAITLGSGSFGSTLTGIVGALTIDGGAGANNSLTLDNSGSSIANIVTLTPTNVGADPGDSFLRPGTSVNYANFQNLTVNTSNAVKGDSISVFPSATTTYFVNAGNPVAPTTQPDTLIMNLTGLTGPKLTSLGTGAGFWSFTNAQKTNFTGIEAQNSLSSLSGVVFSDLNGDGVKGPGDTGIGGLVVTLFDANNVQVAQQTTAADGSYQFFVAAGIYHLVETVPAGVQLTTPALPPVTVVFGSTDVANLNFGNFTLTTIGGVVFQDNNGNGSKDAGDNGLLGWTIDLDLNADGVVDQTAVSDASGNYSFPNLRPGIYRIREEGQTGWLQTTTNPNDITNTSGVDHTTVNFGNFQLITIAGTVFNDQTGNGVLDGSDAGLAGWKVDLDMNADGTVDSTVVTDGSGHYSFPSLKPGTYRIRVEGQTGWLTTNTPADIVAQSGQNQTSVNLGVFQQFTLSGTVYFDANANGKQDTGENGLQGWMVFLDTNGNGTLDSGEPSTLSDANGKFSFANLGPGTYKVREVVQTGWAQTSATPTDIVGQSGLNQVASFGNYQVIDISGQVYNDLNGNGSKQAGETGLQGWTVFLDTNANGKLDPGEPSTTSDNSGNFDLKVAISGSVRLAEVVQSGFVQTTQQSLINLQSGLVFSEDIGNFQTVSITGQVFVDTDATGINTGSKPGRNGVQISLYSDVNKNGIFDANVDTLVATSTSAQSGNQNGFYSFTAVAPGAYLVLETAIAGSGQTAPTAPGYYAFTALSGTNITGKDFGNLAGVAQSYLFVLYQDLFNRRIDATGLAYWSAVLARGVSRQLVVQQLAASTEGYTKVVNDIYQAYLGRQADAQGLANGIKILSTEPPPANFTPQQQLKDLLLGSQEFFASRGAGSNQQFVNVMYYNVTGASPTSDVAGALMSELTGGADRGTVAAQILKSDAGFDFVIQNYYQQLLHRAADSTGLAFFLGNLKHGGREEAIQQVLLGSNEYFNSL
jgi:hypothetical protein